MKTSVMGLLKLIGLIVLMFVVVIICGGILMCYYIPKVMKQIFNK